MKTEKYEILNAAKLNDSIDELIGYNYVDCEFPNNDMDYSNAIIMEDEHDWFIDLGTGLGFAQYSKSDFTLKEVIDNETND